MTEASPPVTCGDYAGEVRCTLTRGHCGDHEARGPFGPAFLRWSAEGRTLAPWLLERIAEDEYRTRNSPYPRDHAECDAKRRIVEAHQPRGHGLQRVACAECWHPDYEPCNTLRLLALPYADHPDYRDEWRP